ncbi:MAG TPA: glycosyltransferase [Ferruginibacter sp.]|nr:glycosyltransferase [Ferruginibacter sp.]
MNDGIFNKKTGSKRVLVAPLDWGLGHATRCIPIIYELLEQDSTVIIAAAGQTEILLKKEFPGLEFLPLRGYNIQYSRKKGWLPLKLFLQIPSIIAIIYHEHRWLKKIVRKNEIDCVISDNRFGLYHSSIPSIYITHQLLIKTGNDFTEKILQKIHYHFIKKYTQCWVPDLEGDHSLAGALSHPKNIPGNIKYTGPLSRFEKKPFDKKYDLLILISGPEPQRSIFEKLLLAQLQTFNGVVLLVRGLPTNELIDLQKNIIVKDHLGANELSEAIQRSTLVITRSGYTTIMDLVKLQQKAVLVPTPRQTEQEYLATHLAEKKIFYTIEQGKFILEDVLQQTKNTDLTIPVIDMQAYKKAITILLAEIIINS